MEELFLGLAHMVDSGLVGMKDFGCGPGVVAKDQVFFRFGPVGRQALFCFLCGKGADDQIAVTQIGAFINVVLSAAGEVFFVAAPDQGLVFLPEGQTSSVEVQDAVRILFLGCCVDPFIVGIDPEPGPCGGKAGVLSLCPLDGGAGGVPAGNMDPPHTACGFPGTCVCGRYDRR